MNPRNPDRWEQLFALLAPVHDRARVTARRLSASPADGDDLFHEALLRAYDRLSGLRDPERFAAWFYAVLFSVHRNRSRRAFWKRFVSLDAPASAGRTELSDGTTPAEDHDRAARMSRALSTLPAVQREAVVLHDIDGYTMEEIALKQGVTVSAIKTRVSRGRKRLRRHYQRLGIGGAREANTHDDDRENSAHG